MSPSARPADRRAISWPVGAARHLPALPGELYSRVILWVGAADTVCRTPDPRAMSEPGGSAPGPELTAAIGRPRPFIGYEPGQAALFAAAWLPAWTGNRPERLAAFYTPDTFYSDPTIPEGVHGRDALTEYLTRLLARAPDWVWTQTASTPMRAGFVNYWQAQVPLGETELRLTGVCLVVLRDGLIARNEVFFDRTPLRDAVRSRRHGVDGP
jgi:hypothetical protein